MAVGCSQIYEHMIVAGWPWHCNLLIRLRTRWSKYRTIPTTGLHNEWGVPRCPPGPGFRRCHPATPGLGPSPWGSLGDQKSSKRGVPTSIREHQYHRKATWGHPRHPRHLRKWEVLHIPKTGVTRHLPSQRSNLFLFFTWQARLPSLLWIYGVCTGSIREDDLTPSYQIFIRFLSDFSVAPPGGFHLTGMREIGWTLFLTWTRRLDAQSSVYPSTSLFRLREMWLTWTEQNLIWIIQG